MDAGQIVVRLLADARALDSGLMSGERRIASFSKRVTRTGDSMTKGLTVPIVAAGAVMTHFALDFEHQLALIGSLVGTNSKQLGKYRQAILDLGPAVGKSPTELAKALYFITSSGFKGAAALRVLEASAKASAAGLGDTATVADAVTSAVNAYGEKALSASKATDIMLAAVREGKAEPEALAQSIGMVIPAASQLGVSFDQVSAALASMTLTGQSASEAAVALNQVFMNSLKPTKEGADTLKTVGMSYADLRDSLKNKGLLPTLDLLNEKFDGNVETMAKVFGNVRSLRAVLALTGAAAGKTAGIFGKLADTTGDTNRAFADMKRNDPGFELRQDWAELQKVLIEFGDVILPMLTDLAREGTKVVEWFDGLDEGSKKVIVGIAGIAAVVGPSLSLIGRMGTGVSTLTSLFGKLAGVIRSTTVEQEALNLAQAGGGKVSGLSAAGQRGAALINKGAAASLPAAYSGAAGMSAASMAAIVAVALSPFVIATIMQKTQKYTEGQQGAAATSQQNKGAGGAFYGSSKGYGGGGGKFRDDAAAATRAAAAVRMMGTAMDGLVSKMAKGDMSLSQGGVAIRGYVDRLREMKKAAIDSGNKPLAAQITRMIEKFRDLQSKSKGVSNAFDGAGKSAQQLGQEINAAKQKAGHLRDEIKVRRKLGLDTSEAKKKLADTQAQIKKLRNQKAKLTIDVDEKALARAKQLGLGGKAGVGAAATVTFKGNTGPLDKSAASAKSKVTALGRMRPTPTVGLNDNASGPILTIQSLLNGLPSSKTITIYTNKVTRDEPQAYGGSYVLNRAQRFLAGEKSKEIASFIPLNDPARAAQVYGQLQGQLARYMPSVFGSGSKTAGASRGASGSSGGAAAPMVYAGPQTVEMPVYLDGELIASYVRDLTDTSEARDGRGHA